jgi:hypothetical protein
MEPSLYVPGTNDYNLAVQHANISISTFFANSPGTMAQAGLAGSALAGSIFFRSGYVESLSPGNTAALLMHEVIHTLGPTDSQLQKALGLSVGAPSDNITQKLLQDCFK